MNNNSRPAAAKFGGDNVQLPSDELVERHVLGYIIVNGEVGEALSILSPESFYNEFHQNVWRAIVRLTSDGAQIDILSIRAELMKIGVNDADVAIRLAELQSISTGVGSISRHVFILQQKYIQRQLVKLGVKVSQASSDNTVDVADTLADIMHTVDTLSEITYSSVIPLRDAIKQASEEINRAQSNSQTSGLSGIPTGLHTIDHFYGGAHDSELTIIAGRPGMGKTSYALSMAYNIAATGRPVMFFSLEMSAASLAKKVLSFQTGVPLANYVKGTMSGEDWSKFDANVGVMSSVPLYFDETPALKLHDLRSRCKVAKEKYGVKCIFIDYLQLIEVPQSRYQIREQVISEISRTLKKIAKELAIPVYAMSQLSRACESRPDKRPQLSDLRESGSIEQDADIIEFVYRPEYYHIPEYEAKPSKDVAVIITAKNRNGQTGENILHFIPDRTLFTNW